MRRWAVRELMRRAQAATRRHRPEAGIPGYNVYLVVGDASQIDTSKPHRMLAAETTVELSGLAPNTPYTVGVAARSRYGRLSELQTASFRTDGSGNAELAPARPIDLQAHALAGGQVELTWLDPADGTVPAATFYVFWDSGTGAMQYGLPIGGVPASGARRRYRWLHTAPLEGRLRYVVRAYSAVGVGEMNEVIAEAVADATGPPPPTEAPTLMQL